MTRPCEQGATSYMPIMVREEPSIKTRRNNINVRANIEVERDLHIHHQDEEIKPLGDKNVIDGHIESNKARSDDKIQANIDNKIYNVEED